MKIKFFSHGFWSKYFLWVVCSEQFLLCRFFSSVRALSCVVQTFLNFVTIYFQHSWFIIFSNKFQMFWIIMSLDFFWIIFWAKYYIDTGYEQCTFCFLQIIESVIFHWRQWTLFLSSFKNQASPIMFAVNIGLLISMIISPKLQYAILLSQQPSSRGNIMS